MTKDKKKNKKNIIKKNNSMAQKKISIKKIPKKTDSNSIEHETIMRVNHTITVMEKFFAKWNSSKIKPDSMSPQIYKIKRFYDVLIKWQKNAVKNQKSKDENARIKRLRDFVLICNTYS